MVTPVALANIKWRYYIIYAVLNFAFAPIVKLFYVETKNFSLEQIDAIFEGNDDVPAGLADRRSFEAGDDELEKHKQNVETLEKVG